jgi:serine/threonine protein kinase
VSEIDPPSGVAKIVVPPQPGEQITSLATGTTYTMGDSIGEGSFGVVFACTDGWGNDLAAKVLKPTRTYEEIQAAAVGEIDRLLLLRHPLITYVYDAFEYRDTFYIVTERCYCPISRPFALENFDGTVWILPIARCLLQAVQYLHINQFAHQDIHANNVFAAFARDEMNADNPGAINFKLGDLGVSKVFGELDAANTLAEWIRPPEALDPAEYGPLDHRIDIYHVGLLFLQFAYSKELRFTREEILAGVPREMAVSDCRLHLTSLSRRRCDGTPRSGPPARLNCGEIYIHRLDCLSLLSKTCWRRRPRISPLSHPAKNTCSASRPNSTLNLSRPGFGPAA